MSIVGIFALCRVSVKEKEKPVVQKNTVCLLCGNAGNDNFFFHQHKSTLYHFRQTQLSQFSMF